MNSARLRELADYVETYDFLWFDMGVFVAKTSCGTSACVAGFGAFLWPQFMKISVTQIDVFGLSEHLALTSGERQALFYPGDGEGGDPENDNVTLWDDTSEIMTYGEITRRGAVATLRRAADTGLIRWSRSEQ